METWVLKLSQVGLPDQPILVQVSRKPGGQKLDLDLLATDGESAYRTKIREKKLDKLRDDDYDGSAEDWQNYLLYAFVSRTKHPLPPVLSENLEVACRFSGKGSKKRLAISLQIAVDGINSRRGSVELAYDENSDDVNLFDWTSQVIEDRDTLQQELEQSKKNTADAESTIASLQTQLEDLVKAKQDHEAQMLSKFALLLNEKKLRIRIQQRQIAEQDLPPKSSSKMKSTFTSRKRKQGALDPPPDGESDSDAFEAMQIDNEDNMEVDQDLEQDSDQAQMTETASESDADSDVSMPMTSQKSSPAKTRSEQGAQLSNTKSATSRQKPDSTPQTRKANKSSADQTADDAETASEDDEL